MMLTIFRSRFAVSPKLETIRRSRVNCSLCNQLYTSKATLSSETPKLQTSDVLSTVTSPRTSSTGKHVKRKSKLTTELLNVQGSSLSQTKATVKKISRKNLDKLHLPSSTSLGDEQIPGDIHESELEYKATELLGDCSLHAPHVPEEPCEDVLSPESAKHDSVPTGSALHSKLSQVDAQALAETGRERALHESILCYLELCVSCGFTHRGWVTLNYYVKRASHTESRKVTDPRLFDVLMHGYASFGNYDKLMDVWSLMESTGVEPTLFSYAHRIEAIARSKKGEKTELLIDTISLLEQKGFELNNMFVETSWVRDGREVVLEAVRVIRPQFLPVNPIPDLSYENPLLDRLNVESNAALVSPAVQNMNEDMLMSYFREQLELEKKAIVTIRSVEKEAENTETTLLYRKMLEDLMKTWEQAILSAMNREILALNNQHKNYRLSYTQLNVYPYLVVLDKHQLKDIIMQEIIKLAEGSETFSPVAAMLHRSVAAQVRHRYILKLKLDSGVLNKVSKMYQKYVRWYLNPQSSSACNSRQQWQSVKHEISSGPSIDLDPTVWPPSVLAGIGKFLYKIILRDIKIDVNMFRSNSKSKNILPAFYTVYRHQGGFLKEEIKPHPVLSRLYRSGRLPYLSFNVNDTPSLCPPIPWSSIHSGGYIVAKTNLIRLPQQAVQQWERMRTSPPNQLYPLYDSLNQLSSIPWKVNQPVLDTIIEVFNTGGSSKLDIPEPPSCVPPVDKVTPEMSDAEKSLLFKQRVLMRRKKAEMYSLWCDALYRLSLANHFRDRIFWLPHNMDFRGRVYPFPPHLNHLGSDMSRSMLLFAKGEPLGPKGLDWLKIHAINLTGIKKRNSIDDRLKYGNEVLHLIIDSAKNPLTGEKWWMESEEPWQTLACCIEINNAINCPQGPENYVSHFPIHQDGSCNGLQHYAALGRDSAGALSVNLTPADVPQDVYSAVAAIVERVRSEEAAEGNEVAKILEGFVRRKVVKQTVMTTVYGVTRFGARLQIAKQLKDIDDFPKQYIWSASQYLASKTFDSIREMFTSTREIQDWFTESARMISNFCGKNVEYLTPLGLPVVQPYVRVSNRSFKNNAGLYNDNQTMDMYEKPNVMKQKNAFPPNFIHSLDSSHMMLTSLYSERAGITFVSVHDCFWTHARSVEIMNKICREQFVSLHSQPILEDLSQFMFHLYGYDEDSMRFADAKTLASMERLNKLLTTLPRRGEFELQNVLDSVYFFS